MLRATDFSTVVEAFSVLLLSNEEMNLDFGFWRYLLQKLRKSSFLRPWKTKSSTPCEPTKMEKITWKAKVSAMTSELVATSPNPQPSPRTIPSDIVTKKVFLKSLKLIPPVADPLSDPLCLQIDIIMPMNMIQLNK